MVHSWTTQCLNRPVYPGFLGSRMEKRRVAHARTRRLPLPFTNARFMLLCRFVPVPGQELCHGSGSARSGSARITLAERNVPVTGKCARKPRVRLSHRWTGCPHPRRVFPAIVHEEAAPAERALEQHALAQRFGRNSAPVRNKGIRLALTGETERLRVATR